MVHQVLEPLSHLFYRTESRHAAGCSRPQTSYDTAVHREAAKSTWRLRLRPQVLCKFDLIKKARGPFFFRAFSLPDGIPFTLQCWSGGFFFAPSSLNPSRVRRVQRSMEYTPLAILETGGSTLTVAVRKKGETTPPYFKLQASGL